MSAQNPYAPPKAVVGDVFDGEVAPALWNPTAAGSWSILFSPIFGAYLHMLNWRALFQILTTECMSMPFCCSLKN